MREERAAHHAARGDPVALGEVGDGLGHPPGRVGKSLPIGVLSNRKKETSRDLAKLVFTPVFASGARAIVLPFTVVCFDEEPDTPGMFGCAGGIGIVL